MNILFSHSGYYIHFLRIFAPEETFQRNRLLKRKNKSSYGYRKKGKQ